MQIQHIICQDLRLLSLVLDDYLVLCIEYWRLGNNSNLLKEEYWVHKDCTLSNVQRKVCLTF
jgi:hypothetical protein